MWGSATLTTVMSSTSMNWISPSTASAFQRRGSGSSGRAAAAGVDWIVVVIGSPPGGVVDSV
jgi:hypothetical protein